MFTTTLFRTVYLLLSVFALADGHARIKAPKPLGAPPENPSGNYYNEPLRSDGSQFPCKGLHKRADISRTPTEVWKAGQMARFEILGHTTAGEGSLAAHSGGSCQASLSFDNGETWKVLHSYEGGCPRDVKLDSNKAGDDQVFFFRVPEQTKAGPALFSWSWIAVTGNRNEFYQNCASVMISGSGTSTLDSFPDMFVGDMSIPDHIGSGECRSTARTALTYPNPGEALTITEVENITFTEPTGGKCFPKASVNPTTSSSTVFTPVTTMSTTMMTTTSKASSPSSTTTQAMTTTASQCRGGSLPNTFKIVVENQPKACTCTCEN